MPKIHEVLAAEKSVNAAWQKLHEETAAKFHKPEFFNGHVKSLKMIDEGPASEALEKAAAEQMPVRTNVHDTLAYALGIYYNAEKLQLQKNATNRAATADVVFRGETLLKGMPVDQLLGLEARLAKIRELYISLPTLDASKNWAWSETEGVWVAPAEQAVKTDKVMTPVILAPATDKHPAQVEKVTKDIPVGTFSLVRRSGAATAVQKAEAIKLIDELLVEVKQARMRANDTEVIVSGDELKPLLTLLMSPFTA